MKKATLVLALMGGLAVGTQAQTSSALDGSCRDDATGTVTLTIDGSIQCASEAVNILDQGYPTIGFHSGANNFANLVSWDDAAAVAATQDAVDPTRYNVTIDIAAYYGIDYCDAENIAFVLNEGVQDSNGNAFDTVGRDTLPGLFGCSDLLAVISELPQCGVTTCDATDGPACLSVSGGVGSGLTISWYPLTGQVGCQVQGGAAGGGTASINILDPNASSFTVPDAQLTPGTTYEVSVRCACSTSPLIVSPLTGPASLAYARTADNSMSLEGVLAPNPASNLMNFQFEANAAAAATFHIIDMTGKIVSVQNVDVFEGMNNVTFDVSNLVDGQYLIRLEGTATTDALSFVVQH